MENANANQQGIEHLEKAFTRIDKTSQEKTAWVAKCIYHFWENILAIVF